jgi:hypothetical protein
VPQTKKIKNDRKKKPRGPEKAAVGELARREAVFHLSDSGTDVGLITPEYVARI